jgi:hypothetical protein
MSKVQSVEEPITIVEFDVGSWRVRPTEAESPCYSNAGYSSNLDNENIS